MPAQLVSLDCFCKLSYEAPAQAPDINKASVCGFSTPSATYKPVAFTLAAWTTKGRIYGTVIVATLRDFAIQGHAHICHVLLLHAVFKDIWGAFNDFSLQVSA